MNSATQWRSMFLVLILSFFVGYAATSSVVNMNQTEALSQNQQIEQEWTCSMHPQVRGKEGDKCPICGMDLIKVENQGIDEEKDANSNRLLKLSPSAEKLAEIETSPVIKAFGRETLSVNGKLFVDETRKETVSAWFPGRIEQLYIDYEGISVQQNEHIARIYSPDLLVAQKELLEAHRVGASRLIESSREKLRLLGVSQSQVRHIEQTKKVSDTLMLRSSIEGVILKKHVNEGEYVKKGSKIYEIANLDRLWFVADVYESDISKLHYGQKATMMTKAYPGTSFEVVITFIDPIVNPKTRTIRVRGIVKNPQKKLKPGMLAKANIQIMQTINGPMIGQDIQDLYVSPMHPEEFSTKPGKCPVCNMKLKKATELGLVPSVSYQKPLLIPETAPLLTGKRAIVYVKDRDKQGIYEGRSIELGPKVGNAYIVLKGLSEGEFVVTNGNFKIDSAMQLQAKPSMMQSGNETHEMPSGHRH